ncbi:MAG: hypothetical protein HY895_10295 [Deltaproteobacteria bacterium]|nr:hypothetical protein [Deltaproteobacteria bacterium]
MKTDRHPSESSAERRREQRFTVSWPVEFSLFGTGNSPGLSAVAIDLSREGLCMKTDRPLKTGVDLCIRIQALRYATECMEETGFARMLSVSEVKWCRQIKDQKHTWYLAGIKHLMGDY